MELDVISFEFVSQLERHRAPRLYGYSGENSPLPQPARNHRWLRRRRRLIYREICPALPRGIPAQNDVGGCSLAWIPNNLICRDLSAISCLLGHVWHSTPALFVCDPRVSYSPSALPPLRLSSFLASSSPFATGGPVTWMIIVTAGDWRLGNPITD